MQRQILWSWGCSCCFCSCVCWNHHKTMVKTKAGVEAAGAGERLRQQQNLCLNKKFLRLWLKIVACLIPELCYRFFSFTGSASAPTPAPVSAPSFGFASIPISTAHVSGTPNAKFQFDCISKRLEIQKSNQGCKRGKQREGAKLPPRCLHPLFSNDVLFRTYIEVECVSVDNIM